MLDTTDSLIRRAMSLIAKRRMTKMSPEKRQQVASIGGKAWWDSLTDQERRERIDRIQKARKEKRAENAKMATSKPAQKTRTKSRKRT
jgi:hypothetical protein